MWPLLCILFMVNVVAAGKLWGFDNRTILFNGTTPFKIRGINWFGYDNNCHVVNGLWVNPIDFYFETMASLSINALRVPFSFETVVEKWDQPPDASCLSANPWMASLSVRETLHVLFHKAAERGIVVLLDFHTVGGRITEYPTDGVTIGQALQMWRTVLNDFAQYDNLIGIDLKNEPHGAVTWVEWGAYVSQVIDSVGEGFRGLFFVEGVQDAASHSVWGGSFTYAPGTLSTGLDRIVFSPHVYGVSIRGLGAGDDRYALYDYWFGNLRFSHPDNPIVIGEIGGMDVDEDHEWHTKIANYLLKRGITDFFYWCLNPNSYDTGGVLEYDWRTINTQKTAFMSRLSPNPTRITFTSQN